MLRRLFTIRLKRPTLAISLAGLWIACVIASIVCFWVRWGVFPTASEIVLGATFLAPFSMPKAFSDTIGLTPLRSTRGMVLLAAIYWPAVIALVVALFRTRLLTLLLALAVILFVTSVNWLVVSTGLLGI